MATKHNTPAKQLARGRYEEKNKESRAKTVFGLRLSDEEREQIDKVRKEGESYPLALKRMAGLR